jgi:hypothetical protein
MIIFKGKEAVFGIQLTIDKVWRYALQSGETCTVKIIDNSKNVITKVYTSADVDSIDKMITVSLSEAETAAMALGRGTLTAYFNDLVSLPPIEFYVKEA